MKCLKKLIDNKKLDGVNCIIWKDGQVIPQESMDRFHVRAQLAQLVGPVHMVVGGKQTQ